jgi:hypothetical protein
MNKILQWGISILFGVAAAWATIQIRMGTIEANALSALSQATQTRVELKELRDNSMQRSEMIYRFDVLTKSIDDLHKDFIDERQKRR